MAKITKKTKVVRKPRISKAKLHKSNTIKKNNLLKALEQTLGVVTTACKQLRYNRTVHYDFLKTDPEYAEAVNEIANVGLDFGESKLYKAMGNDNIAAIIYFLKTKGRCRGFSEHIDINQTSKSVGVIVQSPPMDLETWEKLGKVSLDNQDKALQVLLENREKNTK